MSFGMGDVLSTRMHSIGISGRRTTVRLEDEMWASFKDVAEKEGCTLQDLASHIYGWRAHADHAAGNAHYGRIVGHRVHHHRPRAHLHVIADSNVAQHLRAGAHHHAIADGGMAFALLIAGTAQGHALVEQHVVADLRGLAYYHAGTVVDEEAASDGGSRMNLNPRQEAADLRNHARH